MSLEPELHNKRTFGALQLESSPHSPQLGKNLHSSEDPAQSKINKIIF